MGDFSPAVVQREADGTRTVLSAGQMILVSTDLLSDPDLDPDVIEPDGTLRLDSAGQYRYRRLWEYGPGVMLYSRISPETD